MTRFSKTAAERRTRNSSALAAFGAVAADDANTSLRTVHQGTGPTVFTIGYERRDGDDLVAALLDAGVDVLVDVRQKAMSRKPDFRGRALRGFCENAGIEYSPMPDLGSTEAQRERLKSTGDFVTFRKRFRDYAKRSRQEQLRQLESLSESRSIALLCYERCHDECHRSILTDLLVESIDVSVVAIA